MDFHSIIQSFDWRDRRNLYLILTAPLVAYSTTKLLISLFARPSNQADKIIRSPRQALQLLSGQDLEDLPYPPNALPGGRDVDTPYGNIRVYEWGPEEGRKVLLVHGISTPCIALASMAKLLVEEGCRVMLFDLFGRGYSDTPDPKQYHQDARLFTTQILLVLSSSNFAWTGPERFTLVGYSLGGGIGMEFTSYFPNLVESLVLIAPAGLIRAKHISRSSRLLYGNMLPESLVSYLIYRRLGGNTMRQPKGRTGTMSTAAIAAAETETPKHPAHAANSIAPIFPDRPSISPANAVSWQLEAHPGFCASFISSIKYAPTFQQHARWQLVGMRQTAQRASSEAEEKTQGLKDGKVLILLGKTDRVIIADETEEDVIAALGQENVTVVKLQGAHDLPITNARGCVDTMIDFWE